MPKCEKCSVDISNAERKTFSVLHFSGVYCDVCYNLLNGLNWVMGASLYGSVWHSLSLQEKSVFIKHYKKNRSDLNETKSF